MEDVGNKMFVGPSGKVFWKLLSQAAALETKMYITNLLKCRLPKNRNPKQAEIQACSLYLEQELQNVKPKIVAPLGYYATKYIIESRKLGFFNKEEYPSLIGKAFICAEFIVIPLTHPTSLIHHPQFWQETVRSYYRAFQLEPCKWFSVCPMRSFTINITIDFYWTDKYCLGSWQKCKRYEMESLGIAHSDYLLPDGSLLSG
jgi:DNA polymerase